MPYGRHCGSGLRRLRGTLITHPRSHRATAMSWADCDATWADADCIVIPPTIIVTVAVPPDLNIDALGFNRSGDRDSRQHCYSCRRDESDLHHWSILL